MRKASCRRLGGQGPRDGRGRGNSRGKMMGAGEHFSASVWEQIVNQSEGMRNRGQDFPFPKKCHPVTAKPEVWRHRDWRTGAVQGAGAPRVCLDLARPGRVPPAPHRPGGRARLTQPLSSHRWRASATCTSLCVSLRPSSLWPSRTISVQPSRLSLTGQSVRRTQSLCPTWTRALPTSRS